MRRIGISVLYNDNAFFRRSDACWIWLELTQYTLSSPVPAGVVGAHRLGSHLGLGDLMNGGRPTAKASLIQDGRFTIMPESEVGDGNAGHRLVQGGGYAIQVPTIDIAEVGAGGGSIAGGGHPGWFQSRTSKRWRGTRTGMLWTRWRRTNCY